MSIKLALLGTGAETFYGFSINNARAFNYRVVSDGDYIYATAALNTSSYTDNMGVLKIDTSIPSIVDSMVVNMGDNSSSFPYSLEVDNDNIYLFGIFFNSPIYSAPEGPPVIVIYVIPKTNLNAPTTKTSIWWSNSYNESVTSDYNFVRASSGSIYFSFNGRVGTTNDAVGYVKLNSSAVVSAAISVTPISNVITLPGSCNVQPNEERIFFSGYSATDPTYPYSTRLMAFTSGNAWSSGVRMSVTNSYIGLRKSYCDNTNFWGLFSTGSTSAGGVPNGMILLKFDNSNLATVPSQNIQYAGFNPRDLLKASNGDFVVVGVSLQGVNGNIDGHCVLRFDSSLNLIYQRKLVWLIGAPNILSNISAFEHKNRLWISVADYSNSKTFVLKLPGATGSGKAENDNFIYDEGNYPTGSATVNLGSITLTPTARTFQNTAITLSNAASNATLTEL